MAQHAVIAGTEDALDVVVGARVEAGAERDNAEARLLLHRVLGVEHQVLAVVAGSARAQRTGCGPS